MFHFINYFNFASSLVLFSSAVEVVICQCWPEGGDWWVEEWRLSALQMIGKPSL